MQELLLVNPRKRRKKKSSAARRSRRRASPAQLAARKKFAAMARSGAFKKRRKHRSRASGKPARRARKAGGRKHRYRTKRPTPRLRRRRAKNTQAGYFPNPGRKTRRRRRSRALSINVGGSMARRRRSRRSSARRRNPINFGNAMRRPMNFIQPALWGAVGAIAVNTFMSRVVPLVLPANMQVMFMTGRLRYLTQGAAAIAVGMLAQKVGVKAATAQRMAEGSLTVTLTDAIRDVALSVGVPLGGIGYYLPGRNAGNAVPSASGAPGVQLRGMNAYVTGPGSVPGNVTPMRRSSMAGGFGPGRTF